LRRATRKCIARLTLTHGLVLLLLLLAGPLVYAVTPEEAPPEGEADDAFGLNGYTLLTQFRADKEIFNTDESIGDGLGPVYNAQSCGDCHQNGSAGKGSQVTELRAGRFDGTTFTEAAGGSLIQDRAIKKVLQEFVSPQDNVRALRLSLNTRGDGYIEAISDQDIIDYRNNQPQAMRGQYIQVPILESPGTTRVGRFGWKDQHASLLSFSADAYRDEMGITSPLRPTENSSNGNSVATYDDVPDPEDNGDDVEAFTRFMRSTRVPSSVRPTDSPGGLVFGNLKCDVCHRPSYTTAPAGSPLHPQYNVPAVLGEKIIYPYSDFLLHDIGTGDGIQLGNKGVTRTRMRTPPLWGLRSRNRLMHDGTSYTLDDAIRRHGGEAASVIHDYIYEITAAERNDLLTFLASL
jgi:CxxC motif-containing protein (DUF1111 family)